MTFVSARSGLSRTSTPNLLSPFQSFQRHVSVNSGIARGLRAEGTPVKERSRDWHASPRQSNDTDFTSQPNQRNPRPAPAQRIISFARPSDFAYEVKKQIPYTTAASQFLPGTRSVTAALSAGRRRAYKLYTVPNYGADVEQIRALARGKGIPIESTDEQAIAARLVGIPGSTRTPHEGVLLECSPIPELPTRSLSLVSPVQGTLTLDLLPQSAEQKLVNGTDSTIPGRGDGWRKPVVLWAHGVTDTGNLGALCRSALFFGVAAVAVTMRGSSAVTPATIKAGAGAPEFVPLLRVSDPATFIRESQAKGWKFFAAVAPSARKKTLDPADMQLNPAVSDPCVLVLGNEEFGLLEDIVRKSDSLVSIPARSNSAAAAGVDSLNVSVAGAILTERFTRTLDGVQKTVQAKVQAERLF